VRPTFEQIVALVVALFVWMLLTNGPAPPGPPAVSHHDFDSDL
jgi:hypothetical protein